MGGNAEARPFVPEYRDGGSFFIAVINRDEEEIP
jgi:hypothetical protein